MLEGGLRADWHSDYGSFLLPRVSLLFLPADDLTLRLGGGFGYKTPNLFVSEAESVQFQGLAPLQPDQLDAEKSAGINFDINYRIQLGTDSALSTNLLFFYTRIDDAVQLTENAGLNVFHQLDSHIDTRGLELNMVFSRGEISYVLGYTHIDARETSSGGDIDLPLVSQHRVNNVLIWEREDNFRIGLEAYYYSPQPRSNDTTGESYWIFGLMAEKQVGETVSLFLNFENFTDTRQTKFENINSGSLSNPIFREIYAPLDGFVANGGVRIKW